VKQKNALIFALFFAAWPVIFSTSVSGAEVVERILAVVNDEIVTEQDIQIIMMPIAARYRTMYTGAELSERLSEARREFLNKAIEDKLVLSEAKKRQVIVKDVEVDEMMAEVRGKFPNREIFLASLEDQGLTEKKLWNRFRDQLMTQKLINFEVKSKVSVSPGEVSEYYKANSQDFVRGDRVKLQQILIRTTSRTEEEARSFAESLVVQIREGKSFEELAKSYSEGAEAKEGGEMGWIEKGQLLGQIEEKVFVLKEGEVTEPVRSALGFHIFKVVSKQSLSPRPLSEVRDKIQDVLFREKLRHRLDNWINNLKKNAYISIR
jgi:parvulin-like peptidyl-prolyl isomerase